MTAEQLEELLVGVEPDYWQYSSAEGRRVWLSPEGNRRSAYARIGMLERRLYSEYSISSLARRVIAAERLVEALEVTRHMVADAAKTGFNHKSGDWSDRLYANNGDITAALTAYREASK